MPPGNSMSNARLWGRLECQWGPGFTALVAASGKDNLEVV
jgi:hypothetical protein